MAGNIKLMTSAGGGVVLDTETTTATDVTVKVPVTGVNNGTLVCSDSSGNVGIGTSSPAAKVHIAGSSATDFDALTLRNGDGTVGSAAVLGFEASTGTLGEDASLAAQIKGIRTGSGTSGALAFWTNNAGVPGERMRINSSGNLLVGTTVASPNGSADIVRIAGGVTASLAYCKERAAGVQVNNGAAVTSTNAVDDQRIVEIVVASLAGANTTAAPGMYLISRAGTGTAITTVAAAAGVTVSLNGSYQVVMTNNSGQTRYLTYTFTVKGGYY